MLNNIIENLRTAAQVRMIKRFAKEVNLSLPYGNLRDIHEYVRPVGYTTVVPYGEKTLEVLGNCRDSAYARDVNTHEVFRFPMKKEGRLVCESILIN